jgi:spore coat protein CotH
MLAAMIAGVVATTSVAACGATAGTATVAGTETTGANATSPSNSSSGANSAASDDAGTLFDSLTVHSIAIDYDQAAYDAMIATYQRTGEKEWISATVTIDGTVFENVGIKLKGNSSLAGLGGQGGPAGGPSTTGDDSGTTTPDATDEMPDTTGVPPDATGEIPDAAATEERSADGEAPRDRVMNGAGASADEPESLPWRIKLDEYVEGQNYQGETDVVVRANNSETSLNEAVALELIAAAGMASEAASPARFSVNGGTEQLRLVVENPNDDWYAENVGVTGILYKAEAGGDYSYRGDDPTAYEDVFDVEANTTGSDSDEYAPLIAFLKWLNESDDAAFAAELDQYLDIDSFADYLAIQDLIENFDDIEGPGNNSYLSYDESTGLFTVISWDHNLAFGGLGGGMRTFAMPDGGTPPTGAEQAPDDGTELTPPIDGAVPPGMDGQQFGGRPGTAPNVDGQAGAGPGMGNVLAERFRADADFAALVEQATADLQASLYDSGTAAQILDEWTAVLKEQATDLVPADTIDTEAAQISQIISG